MRKQLNIEIAETICSFMMEDLMLHESCQDIYRGFITDKQGDMKVDVSIDDTYTEILPTPVITETENNIYRAKSDSFDLQLDFENMTGTAKIASGWRVFDLLLRVVYSIMLPRGNAVIIHASGVIKDESGYVFSGPPESGKSTVHQLSLDYSTISDELLVLKRVNGQCHVYDSPFWNYRPMTGDPKTNAQVKAILLLNQSKSTFAHYIDPLHAMARMLPNVFYDSENLEISQETIKTCCSVIENTACYDFYFQPDKDEIWRCLDGLN